MFKFYLFVTVICAVGIQVSLEQKCHFEYFDNCLLGLTRYAKESETPYPRNEKELIKQCEYLEDTRNCMYNYTVNCMTQLERTLGDFLVSSTAQKMRNLCNPDHELYKNFARNGACIAEKYGGTTPCIKSVLATIEILSETKPEERLATFCCAFTNFRSCLVTHFREACNPDVAVLMELIVEIPVSEAIVQTCISYREAGGKCPDLPSANDVKGTYRNTFLGSLVEPFLVE